MLAGTFTSANLFHDRSWGHMKSEHQQAPTAGSDRSRTSSVNFVLCFGFLFWFSELVKENFVLVHRKVLALGASVQRKVFVRCEPLGIVNRDCSFVGHLYTVRWFCTVYSALAEVRD